MGHGHCRLVRHPLDLARLAREVAHASDGAVATFTGIVRNHHRGRPVDRLEYHAYEAMAVEEMERIAESLARRHGISGLAIEHRLGTLGVGEVSIIIAVAAPHRGPALACCGEAIEAVKRLVPIWKKEYFTDGGEPAWVLGPEEAATGTGGAEHG